MTLPKLLRISILPFNGLFEVEREKLGTMQIIGGLEAQFVQLMGKFLGTEMEIVAPDDGEWGRETANGSWTGLVGMVLRKEADIALGGIAVTEKRSKIIHYSLPYRYTYLTFATNLPPEIPKFWTFLYPFTLNLWISVALLLLVMPFVFRLCLTTKMTLANHFFDAMKSLLYEPLTTEPSGSANDYFVLGSWLIGSMIISYSYAATLLSFLTIPLREPGVHNIKELSDLVVEGKFRAGCFKGTNVVNILRASEHASIAALGDHIIENEYDIEPDKESVGQFYKSKKSALIAPEVYFLMNFPNTLQIAPEPLKCTAISMVMKKSFCCKQQVDTYISRVFDSGISQQITKRVLLKIEIKNSLTNTASENTMTLNLEDFFGAFLFHGLGMIVSVSALIGEIIIKKMK